jgi:hypothetical protein
MNYNLILFLWCYIYFNIYSSYLKLLFLSTLFVYYNYTYILLFLKRWNNKYINIFLKKLNLLIIVINIGIKLVEYNLNKLYKEIIKKYKKENVEYDKEKNILKIKYEFENKEYIYIQRINKKQIHNIISCTSDNKDIFDKIQTYLGPNKNFHNENITPLLLGYNSIEIHKLTEDFDIETKIFNENDKIII